MADQFVQYPSPQVTQTPAKYNLNGVAIEVSRDTSTPANSRPLPVSPLNTSGVAVDPATEGTLSALNSKLPSLGQQATSGSVSVVVASGQTVPVSASSLPLPTGAATETTLAAASAKFPATLGQKTMASSMAVTLASDQSAVPISAASLPLPTGAATESTLSGMSAKLPASLGAKTTANSVAVNIASDQTVPVSAASLPLPTGAATEATLSGLSGKFGSLGQKAMAGSTPVVIASDQSAVPVSVQGNTPQGFIRNDYTATNVTTGAYVQLTAATATALRAIEVFDSSGQSLKIAFGAAGSEVDKFAVLPGGNGRIPCVIPSGTRLSVKAVSGTASSGELIINLYS